MHSSSLLASRRRAPHKGKQPAREQPASPPPSSSSCEMNDNDDETAEWRSQIDKLQPFEGPFELATVLLDLLESSFCNQYSLCQETDACHARKRISHSPMSVAIQLISAITALQQSKGGKSVTRKAKFLFYSVWKTLPVYTARS